MNRQWFIWVLALVAFAPGCGPDLQTLCEEQEACLGGNEMDIAACVASLDGARDNAYDIGCGEEYDVLLECLTPKLDCNTTGTCASADECNGSACIDGECKSYAADASGADDCEKELNAYARCD